MQAVIGATTGDTFQVDMDEQQVQAVTGLSIGEEVDGGVFGLDGYTLEIRGGSDEDGFPMRETVDGTGRRKLLVEKGERDGERQRQSFRGNTVSDAIAQLNLSVVEQGSDDIGTLLSDEGE